MKRFNFMDPEMIMSIVIAIVVLGVGVFAFWVTSSSINEVAPVVTPSATSTLDQNSTYYTWYYMHGNTSDTGNSVFNIVGIVLVIGAIMTIVGLVYSYVRPGGF